MHPKQGQAALEFLMTYGWAILIVLIAIGALAYFGVLNPQRLLPKSCTIVPGMSCDDFIVVSDGTATVIVRNGGARSLTAYGATTGLPSIEISKADGTKVNGTCTGVGFTGTTEWPTGEQISCTWTGNNTLDTGTKGTGFSEDLVVYYRERGSTIDHRVVGQLATRYE